jgi:hypothetical protein
MQLEEWFVSDDLAVQQDVGTHRSTPNTASLWSSSFASWFKSAKRRSISGRNGRQLPFCDGGQTRNLVIKMAVAFVLRSAIEWRRSISNCFELAWALFLNAEGRS